MWSPERLYPSHHIIENVCVWRVPTKCHAAVTMDEIGPTVRFPGPGRPGTAGAAPAPSCCLRPVTTCVRSYQTNFGHRETPSHPKQTGRLLQRRLSNISGNRLFLDKNKTSVSKWLITLFPVRTVERLLLQRQQKQAWGGLVCLLINIPVFFPLSIPTFWYWCTKVHIWHRGGTCPRCWGQDKVRGTFGLSLSWLSSAFRVETCCGSGSRRLRGHRDQATLPWLRHQGLSHLKGTRPGGCRKTRSTRSISPLYLPSMI